MWSRHPYCLYQEEKPPFWGGFFLFFGIFFTRITIFAFLLSRIILYYFSKCY